MTDAIRQTIEILEHEIEALEQRRGELLRTIDALRPLADSSSAAHNGAGRGRTRSTQGTKPRRSVRPRPRTPEALRSARAVPAAALDHHNRDQPRTEAVLKLLANGSLSTKTIAAHLGQDWKILKMALQRLKKSGALMQVGHGPGTKWMLPARPAKEAP